ncbi:hypothetical protein CXK86_26960 [Paenibacillus sp. BGI2013]|nr:hypothetical protein BK136_25425 [Paenibacillus amylolyticus]PKQ88094.1 hypothetical protein CXK86_26960 [Paenibacillus sp. BGI2013]
MCLMKGGEKQWHVDVLAERLRVWLICKPIVLQEVVNLVLPFIPKHCMQTRNNSANKAMVQLQNQFALLKRAAAINLRFLKEGDIHSPSFLLGGINLWVNMLICDKIHINNNKFVLGGIINRIEVPTYPFIIKFSCLIKIAGLPEFNTVQTELRIINSAHEILGTTMHIHRNYRERNMVPGVDQYFDFKILMEKDDNIFIECIVDGELKSSYPINIDLVDISC